MGKIGSDSWGYFNVDHKVKHIIVAAEEGSYDEGRAWHRYPSKIYHEPAPEITRENPSTPVTVNPGESVKFEISASDEDGNLDKVKWGTSAGPQLRRTESLSGSSDSDSYWLEKGRKLYDWSKQYDPSKQDGEKGFEKVIEQFHNNGIRVLGAHWVESYDKWKTGSSEINVSDKILNIEGIDGLIINAENDTKAGVENYKGYIKSIREMHKDAFIGYTSYARADGYRKDLHELFSKYCDVVMPQAYWQHRPTTPEKEIEKMEEDIGKLRDKWNNKPIMPMGQGYYYNHTSKKEEVINDEKAEEMANGISEFCKILKDKGYLGVSLFAYHTMHQKTWEAYAECFAPPTVVFDTEQPENPYPSIFGTYNGTITPNQTIIATKLYTYPCPGTGGHTKSARIWNSTWNATATWDGYVDDWHNITFDRTVILMANETYNYTIRTGSYPQIIHEYEFNATGGKITCKEFVDANGKRYDDWILAIKFYA